MSKLTTALLLSIACLSVPAARAETSREYLEKIRNNEFCPTVGKLFGSGAEAKIAENRFPNEAFFELPDLLSYTDGQKSGYRDVITLLWKGQAQGDIPAALKAGLATETHQTGQFFYALALSDLISGKKAAKKPTVEELNKAIELFKSLAQKNPENGSFAFFMASAVAKLNEATQKTPENATVPGKARLAFDILSNATTFRSPWQQLSTYVLQKGFLNPTALVIAAGIEVSLPVPDYGQMHALASWIPTAKLPKKNLEQYVALARHVYEKEARLRSFKQGLVWNALDYSVAQAIGRIAWKELNPGKKNQPEFLTRKYNWYTETYTRKSRIAAVTAIIRKQKPCDMKVVNAYFSDEKQKAIEAFKASRLKLK